MKKKIKRQTASTHDVNTEGRQRRPVDEMETFVLEAESVLWTLSRALNDMANESPTPTELRAAHVLAINYAAEATRIRERVLEAA